jgi:hypothetical protein
LIVAPQIHQAKTRICRSARSTSAVVAALLLAIVPAGCRDTASTSGRQRPQTQKYQSDRGDALFKTAVSQLNDLPAAVDIEMRPPVVVLDAGKSADRQEVFATCVANPNNGLVQVIQVPAQNGRFRSLGVHSGDVLKYYLLQDQTVDEERRAAGFERLLPMTFTVAQVLDDNTLLLEKGISTSVVKEYLRYMARVLKAKNLLDQATLAQGLVVPAKIEILRYVDDRIRETGEALRLYEIYRKPPLGWEPAPDERVISQVLTWLNQWARQSDSKIDWSRDALLDSIDSDLRANPDLAAYISPTALSDGAFQPHEVRLIQEAIWLRDISKWAHGDGFDDISRASALFDWTVRNIQLEAGADAASHRPWHTVLYGHGTAEQRAWVFARLARQQGLEVVMLRGLDGPSGAESPERGAHAKFWLPALFSRGQLYLFDAQLGLAIPGPGGKGIASLDQVRKDDALLRQLDIEGAAYPISSKSLQNIDIDLVSDPFSLSKRARHFEASLSGEERVVLSAKPSELAGRLRSITGVHSTRLWDLPFRTLQEQLALKIADRRRDKLEIEPFAYRPALWKARVRHFQGRHDDALGDALERKDKRPSEGYMSRSVRPTDTEINNAASEDQRRIDSTAKHSAAYWIGLLSFDDGKYSVAASWFTRPELTARDSPWAAGARYNLARALESQGKLEEAIAVLEQDSTPQQHGNKLRARVLSSRLKDVEKSK